MRKKLSEMEPRERFWTGDCRSRKGLFVGPCKGGWVVQDCESGGLYRYCDNNEYEIIPPTPEPKYRPFKDAAEFEPHRDRWLREGSRTFQVRCYVPAGAWVSNDARRFSWNELFHSMTFDDGSPFGVLEE